MDWEDAMSFEDVVESVAKEWADRVREPEIYEDLKHDLLIALVTSVTLDTVTGSRRNYVRGACWKIAHTMLLSPAAIAARSKVQLEGLVARHGVQISEHRELIWPSTYRTRRFPDHNGEE
jgi:hypothetical protein